MTASPDHTFRIELTFSIALKSATINASSCNKITHISLDEEEPTSLLYENCFHRKDPETEYQPSDSSRPTTLCKCDITKRIAKTLHDGGIQAYCMQPNGAYSSFRNKYTNWLISEDFTTARGPPIEEKEGKRRYQWLPIQILSPKFACTKSSINIVKRFCDLLRTKYQIFIHEASTLSVHIGMSDFLMQFRTKAFIRLIWTIEPQLDIIHPPSRRNSPSALSMRDGSRFTHEFMAKHGTRPSLLDASRILGQTDNMAELGRLFSSHPEPEDGAYCFHGLRTCEMWGPKTPEQEGGPEPSIEFRQHVGTLDSMAVEMWLRTLIELTTYTHIYSGIITRDTKDRALTYDRPIKRYEQLRTCVYVNVGMRERWQKLGDGRDEVRERMYGKTVADGEVTMARLFELLQLPELAEHYRDKLFVQDNGLKSIAKNRIELPDGTTTCFGDILPYHTTWVYEKAFDLNSEAYVAAERQRIEWEEQQSLRTADDASGMNCNFDADAPIWPAHVTRKFETGISCSSFEESCRPEMPEAPLLNSKTDADVDLDSEADKLEDCNFIDSYELVYPKALGETSMLVRGDSVGSKPSSDGDEHVFGSQNDGDEETKDFEDTNYCILDLAGNDFHVEGFGDQDSVKEYEYNSESGSGKSEHEELGTFTEPVLVDRKTSCRFGGGNEYSFQKTSPWTDEVYGVKFDIKEEMKESAETYKSTTCDSSNELSIFQDREAETEKKSDQDNYKNKNDSDDYQENDSVDEHGAESISEEEIKGLLGTPGPIASILDDPIESQSYDSSRTGQAYGKIEDLSDGDCQGTGRDVETEDCILIDEDEGRSGSEEEEDDGWDMIQTISLRN